MKLSVIIPTLNEADYLGKTVEQVRKQAKTPEQIEIIVVDSGSSDGTQEKARQLNCQVLENSNNAYKSQALNEGAYKAIGNYLLFLDADSRVPQDFDQSIYDALERHRIIGGAFRFAMDGPEYGLRVVEMINRIRYFLWKEYYGDQGIFVRKEAFKKVGGYPERKILEASDFCKELKRHGKLLLIRKKMFTSPRRFTEGGIYTILFKDFKIWFLDKLGLQTDHYGDAYWAYNRKRGSYPVEQ